MNKIPDGWPPPSLSTKQVREAERIQRQPVNIHANSIVAGFLVVFLAMFAGMVIGFVVGRYL